MTDAIIAYHFTGDTLRDGRPIPLVGENLIHEGQIEICVSGLHASAHPFDALRYAPGAWLHRVKCEEVVEHENDKFACRKRTILATSDATYMLQRFAADQALSVAHMWDMPCVVREYLTTLDKSKKNAAWGSARDAAWTAARDAARDAAWAAAGAAARDDFQKRVDTLLEAT